MAGYLLDTHVLLWWLGDSARLSPRVRDVLADGTQRLVWSAASTWELAIKFKLGKLSLPDPLETMIPRVLAEQGLSSLPVEQSHAARVAGLPFHHRDPFDRLLISQAQLEALTLLSVDSGLRCGGCMVTRFPGGNLSTDLEPTRESPSDKGRRLRSWVTSIAFSASAWP